MIDCGLILVPEFNGRRKTTQMVLKWLFEPHRASEKANYLVFEMHILLTK